MKSVIPKVRRRVAKVRKKLSWTHKLILIVGPIDWLTYARKYFIFGKFSNNCQIKIFDHCSHRKFSLSSWKIPFLFLKYWYGDFSNCRKGILNPYLYYALNNKSLMAKFKGIICHWSFVEIRMLGLFLERVWKGKPRIVTTSGRKRRNMSRGFKLFYNRRYFLNFRRYLKKIRLRAIRGSGCGSSWNLAFCGPKNVLQRLEIIKCFWKKNPITCNHTTS